MSTESQGGMKPSQRLDATAKLKNIPMKPAAQPKVWIVTMFIDDKKFSSSPKHHYSKLISWN